MYVASYIATYLESYNSSYRNTCTVNLTSGVTVGTSQLTIFLMGKLHKSMVTIMSNILLMPSGIKYSTSAGISKIMP